VSTSGFLKTYFQFAVPPSSGKNIQKTREKKKKKKVECVSLSSFLKNYFQFAGKRNHYCPSSGKNRQKTRRSRRREKK
jgi:hypothetical protein